MSNIKLSDYVVNFFEDRVNLKDVFTLSGGMVMHLLDSFGHSSKINVIPMHHEQAAGIAANTYGRILNIPSLCLVTSGPGSTNAVTPCAGAWMESNPMFFMSGQVSKNNEKGSLKIRQRGIQELDIISVVDSITKYSVKIDDAQSIRYHLEKALYFATTGRPGPVWIDIPVDLQGAMIDGDSLYGFTPSLIEQDMAGYKVTKKVVDQITAKISKSKRPLLVLGQGVRLSGAESLVSQLVETLGIPVQTSWNGMDLIDYRHPLYMGRANQFGMRYANMIIQSSDLIISIGAKLGIQHTGYNIKGFARDAEIIMVDLDSSEMEKPFLNIDLKIRSNAKDVIENLIKHKITKKKLEITEWLDYCSYIKNKYDTKFDLETLKDNEYVDPYYFVNLLRNSTKDSDIFTFDSSGMAFNIVGGTYCVKKGQRAFNFKGLAAMGYGLPCAIGASIAEPDKKVFTVIGEGSLQLNLQELQTIRQFKLPVKLIVFNNGGYHSIHMTQSNLFNKNFVGAGPESNVSFPEVSGLAELYGFEYHKICKNQDIDKIYKEFTSNNNPAFLEVYIDPTKPLEPKLVSIKKDDGTMETRPLEDMFPLLDRDELQKDMLIKILS